MADAINWHCPHCHHKVTITGDRRSIDVHYLSIDNANGKLALLSEFRVCPNAECRKASLSAALFDWAYYSGTYREKLGSPVRPRWSIIPESNARPFPDYVPQPIRGDYEEGCLIRDLSPKASATLARRALQGILRDFYGVKAGRLVDEINQLKDTMEPELWEAIDGVRNVGNIGAHMEKDINVIVDVDPNEAQILLELVETIIEETYVRRASRRARIERVTTLAAEKKEERQPPAKAPATKAGGSEPAS